MTQTLKAFSFIATILSIVLACYVIKDRYFGTLPNISGNWEIKFNINESSYIPYIGKSMTFKLFFTQVNNEIEAKGEKWWIDDIEIPFEQHDPLELKGTIEGDKLVCTYTLKGIKRTTYGNLDILISKDTRRVEGKFTGTVADTKGTINGMKK